MMRNILFLICALALFTAGLTSVAHADIPNMECSHHVADTANFDQDCADDQTQDQADLGECQDCCCIHSHVLAGTLTDISNTPTPNNRMGFVLHTPLLSKERSSLYRPPIA